MKSAKKNFLYNIIYQLFIFIIPLITAPYLSRVVGAEGVGIYSYTYSIVYYFMILTLLGVNNYGNRSIAKNRENKNELSKTFWSIYFLQLSFGFIMIICYIFYINIFNVKYKSIALIQLMYIVSSLLDINWFFFGIEEFKKTITRNTIVKILTVIFILTFVKGPNDVWKYTIIMSGMAFISQLILWAFMKEKVSFVKVSFKDVIVHLKPNLILFIPVISVSLYKMIDKIMLGSFVNVTEVGLYENAEKIISIPLTFISALGTVMLPRITNIISKGNNEKIKDYISKSINFVMFMSFPMCFGLIAISYYFAPLFFGEDFQKTGILITLLAITLPFLGIANVVRTQFLIPKEKDKVYIYSVGLGAIINLVMNLVFIPKFYSIGACIGTISAEIIVMMVQCIFVNKEIGVFKIIKEGIPFFIKSLIMLLFIFPFNFLSINSLLRLMLQLLLGCLIYLFLNFNYILSVFNFKEIIRKKSINK